MCRLRPRGARSTCRIVLRAQSPRSIPMWCAISDSGGLRGRRTLSSKLPPPRRSVRVSYAPQPATNDLRAGWAARRDPGRINAVTPCKMSRSISPPPFADAPVQVDASIARPIRPQPRWSANDDAVWEGPDVDRHTSAQLTTARRKDLRRTFGILSRMSASSRAISAAGWQQVAILCRRDTRRDRARDVNRPSESRDERPQLFHMTTYRTASAAAACGSARTVTAGSRPTARNALVRVRAFRYLHRPVCGAARMLYAAPKQADAATPRQARSAAIPIRCARPATQSG